MPFPHFQKPSTLPREMLLSSMRWTLLCWKWIGLCEKIHEGIFTRTWDFILDWASPHHSPATLLLFNQPLRLWNNICDSYNYTFHTTQHISLGWGLCMCLIIVHVYVSNTALSTTTTTTLIKLTSMTVECPSILSVFIVDLDITPAIFCHCGVVAQGNNTCSSCARSSAWGLWCGHRAVETTLFTFCLSCLPP